MKRSAQLAFYLPFTYKKKKESKTRVPSASLFYISFLFFLKCKGANCSRLPFLHLSFCYLLKMLCAISRSSLFVHRRFFLSFFSRQPSQLFSRYVCVCVCLCVYIYMCVCCLQCTSNVSLYLCCGKVCSPHRQMIGFFWEGKNAAIASKSAMFCHPFFFSLLPQYDWCSLSR